MTSAAEQESGGLAVSRVGAELRAARLRLGWSLHEIAAELRIRYPYLEAIEEGRIADLPGAAYAVGFVRTYGQRLGLDPDEVARRFRAEAHDVNRKTELEFPAPVPERGVPAGAVVLLGLVLAVGFYAAWYKFSSLRQQETAVPAVPERLAPLAERLPLANQSPQIASILPAPAPSPVVAPLAPLASTPTAALAAPLMAIPTVPVPVPVPVSMTPPLPPQAAATAAAEASRVVLKFRADSYIQVREKQGPVLINRVMRAGESWPVPKEGNLMLTTGNAGGMDIVVDGVTGAALGPNGAVRRDIALDPDAIKLPPGARLPPGPRPQ